MNVLLVSGRGMCLSLGLKCLYLLLTQFLLMLWVSPEKPFPSCPTHGGRSSFLSCAPSASWPGAQHGFYMSVCAFDGLSWYVYGPGEQQGLPLPAMCLYLLVFVKWMNQLGSFHREQPFFSTLLQLLVQGSMSLQGSWCGSLHQDDGTFWRIFIVTLIALRCDL